MANTTFSFAAAPTTRPLLGRDRRSDRHLGACWSDYASVLGGDCSAHQARSVHPALGSLAAAIGEFVGDLGTPILPQRAPSLIGTDDCPPEATARLVIGCVDKTASLQPHLDGQLRAVRREARQRLATASRGGLGRKLWLWVTERDARMHAADALPGAALLVAPWGPDALLDLLCATVRAMALPPVVVLHDYRAPGTGLSQVSR